ncbi:hypothetical protein MKK69_18805, partial [Methylobacterium sp. J-026]|nr:hypothetical protein [Methylobacterium sp. J-026]
MHPVARTGEGAPVPAPAATAGRSRERSRARRQTAAERLAAAPEEPAAGLTDASSAADALRRSMEQSPACPAEAAVAAQDAPGSICVHVRRFVPPLTALGARPPVPPRSRPR